MTQIDVSEIFLFREMPIELAKLNAANDQLSKELTISENRTQFFKGACGCLVIVTFGVIALAAYTNYKSKKYEKQGTTKEES